MNGDAVELMSSIMFQWDGIKGWCLWERGRLLTWVLPDRVLNRNLNGIV